MSLPFTVEQFLGVFARYNEAVWPAQLLLNAAAAVALLLVLRPGRSTGRWVSGVLAFFWAWMGVVYHWAFFARINPAAHLFGALFLLQAAFFLAAGVLRPGVSFRARGDLRGVAGAAMIGYSLIVYPLLGYSAGRVYPESPTFGLPCPTTIFTFGLLLLADRRVPLRLLAIPALWSIVGSLGAFSLTITEDYGLPVAGILGTVLSRFALTGTDPRHAAATSG